SLYRPASSMLVMSPVSTIRRYAELGVDPDPSEAWRVRCGRVGQGDRAASEQARSDQARGKWTRIKREIADFFTNKESEYFDLVGSEIPLRWLAMKPGHEPRRRFTEVEIEN